MIEEIALKKLTKHFAADSIGKAEGNDDDDDDDDNSEENTSSVDKGFENPILASRAPNTGSEVSE